MTFRVGFLGYGFMGTAHANALARLPMFFPDAPETDRHVLIGRDEAALAREADRLGFTRTETDWEAVEFDHATMTGFPLLGKHAQARCEDCHIEASDQVKLSASL